MALNAALIWETRQSGSSANGGGFRNNPSLSPPSAPSVSGSGSGGTVAANTYYVVLTYTQGGIETPISGQTSVTTTGATSSITVTHPSDPGNTTTWNCYVGTTSGGPYFPQGTGLAIGSNRSITTTPPTSGTQPAGTDRTLSTTPFVAVDNSAITATTAGANSNVITFTGYTPTGADVGNVYHHLTGTNTNAGFYEVIGVTSTTWTVTGATNLTTAGGAGSALTGNMGGAVDHPATIAASMVDSNIAFLKYSATPFLFGSTANASGGRVSSVTGMTNGFVWQGYDTTRSVNNTDANRPICRANATSITLFTLSNAPHQINNLSFDNPSANATVAGVNASGRVSRCKFDGMTARSIDNNSTSGRAEDCEVTGAALTGSSHVNFFAATRVVVRNCTGTAQGFTSGSTGASCEECIVDTIGGDGYAGGSNTVRYRNCTARTCTGAGFLLAGGSWAERCESYGNTTYGFGLAASDAKALIRDCRAGNNTTADYQGTFRAYQVVGFVSLSGDPNTNAAGGDYSLNGTAGAGAACKGLTVAFPGGATTSYPDAGAVQSAASGACFSPIGGPFIKGV